MRAEIKERIEQVRRGEIPEGYRQQKHCVFPEEWNYEKLGRYLLEHDELSYDVHSHPIATSSRQGLMRQSEYYSNQRYANATGGFHVVPEGYVTYRHMSDDDVFHFNINEMGQSVLVSPEYPVFTISTGAVQSLIVNYLNEMKAFRAFSAAKKRGSTRTRMYFNKLCEFSLPFPSYREQEIIAEILSCCDKVIALKKELIAEKRRQKTGLMQKLLDPNSTKAPFRIRQFLLSDLCKINECTLGNSTEDGYSFFYIDIAAVDNGKLSYPNQKTTYKDAPVRARRVIRKNDILMSTVRPHLHSFFYVDFDCDDFIASTGFAVLTPRQGVSGNLVYQKLFSTTLDRQYADMLVGTNYPALNATYVANLKISIPASYEEQAAIANILATADREIVLLEQELAGWEQKRKALMQLLLTGLVRV